MAIRLLTPGSGRIYLVITNAGSSIVSNFLAVFLFYWQRIKRREEGIAL